MLNIANLRAQIESTLKPMGLYSPEAEELLCATCAQESLLGTYRVQMNGPAVGIFQMEPEDYNDIWTNYLKYNFQLSVQVSALAEGNVGAQQLIDNDPLAIAMARIHYLRAPEPLPAATDLAGLWQLYKLRYNTPQGAAKQQDFYGHYHSLVQGPAR